MKYFNKQLNENPYDKTELSRLEGCAMKHGVLFMETDADLCFLHSKFLQRIEPSLDVVMSSDPFEAISLIEKNQVKVVVSRYDLGLDKPTGIEIIKLIRKRGFNIPTILITDSRSDTAVHALEEGAEYYIHLNFDDPDTFYKQLAALINRAIQLAEERRNCAAAQAKLRAIYDNPTIGIMGLDSQMNVKESNKRMCGLSGYPEEKLRNLNLFSLLSNRMENGNGFRKKFGSEHDIVEKPIQKNEGNPLWARLTLSSIGGNSVDDVSFMALFQDITREKEATFSSENYRRIITAMTNHSHVSRHIVDTEGIIHSVNGLWLDLTNYTQSEIIGMNFLNLLDEDSKSKVDAIIPEEELDSVLLKFIGKNGTYTKCVVSSVNMRNKFGRIHRICFVSRPIGLAK